MPLIELTGKRSGPERERFISVPDIGSAQVAEIILTAHYGLNRNAIISFPVVVLRGVGDIGRLFDLDYNVLYIPDANFEGFVTRRLVAKPSAAAVRLS